MEPTIDQAWQQAVAAHESGNWPEAERRYRAMLQDRPGHPDANHHLGLLAVAVGKPDAALPFLKTALEADPARGQYWIGYIDTLIKAGQIDNARQVLQQGRHLGLQGEAVDRLEQLVCAPAPAQRETLSGILTPSQAAYRNFSKSHGSRIKMLATSGKVSPHD